MVIISFIFITPLLGVMFNVFWLIVKERPFCSIFSLCTYIFIYLKMVKRMTETCNRKY